MTTVSISLTDDKARFQIDGDCLCWIGPIEGSDSPMVCFSANGPWVLAAVNGDAKGLDLPPFAVPSGLWGELAKRCSGPEVLSLITRGGIADLRWRYALIRQLKSAQKNPSVESDSPKKLLDSSEKISHMLSTNSGLVYLTKTHLSLLDSWSHPLSDKYLYTLPKPLALEDGLALVRYQKSQQEKRYQLHVELYSEQGSIIAIGVGSISSYPHFFAYRGGQIWIISRYEISGLQTDTSPQKKEIHIPRGVHGGGYGYDIKMLGEWLAIPGPENAKQHKLCWLNLETAERRHIPWSRVDKWHVVQDQLIAITDEALWKVTPHGAPEKLSEVYYNDYAVGVHIWVATSSGCYRDGEELEAPASSYHAIALPCGVIFAAWHSWTYLNNDGEVLHQTTEGDPRGTFSHHQIDSSRFAFSNGNDFGIIDDKGEILYLSKMPKTGRIIGATDDYFLFGDWDSYATDIANTQLVAIHKDGIGNSRITGDRWKGQLLIRYAGGSTADFAGIIENHIYLTSREGGLYLWTPSCSSALPSIPEAMPPVYNETHSGYSTSVPRDAYPEPGIQRIGHNQLIAQGEYGGSTGYAPAPAIDIQSGATVTFHNCKFVSGELQVRDHSTVFLINCTEDILEDTDEYSYIIRL